MKRKEFEKRRNRHYNEFQAIKLARELMKLDDEEDDEDEDEQKEQEASGQW